MKQNLHSKLDSNKFIQFDTIYFQGVSDRFNFQRYILPGNMQSLAVSQTGDIAILRFFWVIYGYNLYS